MRWTDEGPISAWTPISGRGRGGGVRGGSQGRPGRAPASPRMPTHPCPPLRMLPTASLWMGRLKSFTATFRFAATSQNSHVSANAPRPSRRMARCVCWGRGGGVKEGGRGVGQRRHPPHTPLLTSNPAGAPCGRPVPQASPSVVAGGRPQDAQPPIAGSDTRPRRARRTTQPPPPGGTAAVCRPTMDRPNADLAALQVRPRAGGGTAPAARGPRCRRRPPPTPP